MKKLGLNEIRERYLRFFESKEHLRLPSFPLVPQNDPSVLLINAGMTPLKPYFTGQETPPKKRMTTCQKCIRTPDIERVGKTARHATFFEMLGNFSFGDYFKKEAAKWAWEFITEDMEMPKDRLWVSIYEEDDEALGIWTKEVGVDANRIVRLGKADNFWEHGLGPCGPCSEVYFDRGEEAGCKSPDCAVGCDCDRFVEFWNLVFTQFDKDEKGNYNLLPKPNIDTGMGLERLAAIMQGVGSIFEVDTIRNIMEHVSKISGVEYGGDSKKDISLRVITDHIRSTVFMVSDGMLPSNEGRGYVLRRLLRRAARHGKLIGIDRTFLWELAGTVISESSDAYPELREKSDYIKKVIRIEEERFDETVDQGLVILNQYIEDIKRKGENVLSGELAFKLYDTYGFPIDLTREILGEQNIEIDEQGFGKEMENQRERARSARHEGDTSAWGGDIFSKLDKDISTIFVGYSELCAEAKVIAIAKEDESVRNASDVEMVSVILDITPFYGESGGQVGDIGTIKNENATIKVTDCKKLGEGKIIHICEVVSGIISVGDSVIASVDVERRKAIMRNHTSTHLLQKALKKVLGDHVNQSGSLVQQDKLRFDFTHFSPMTEEEVERVEREVNDKIMDSLEVEAMEKPINEAKIMGATALFGEKYGDVVRLIKVDDYSLELCGGCHLSNTSQAGLFKITSETGVAAGVRRIEALTGKSALEFYKNREQMLGEAAQVLKCGINDITKKAETIVSELKNTNKELEALRGKLAGGMVDDIIATSNIVNGVKVISSKIEGMNNDSLRELGDKLREKIGSGVIVLASGFEGKVSIVAMATKDAVSKGVHAGNIIKEVAKTTGGGGGGRPDMAQAGGKDATKIDEALAIVGDLVSRQIENRK